MIQKIIFFFLYLFLIKNVSSQTVLEKFQTYQNSFHFEKLYISHDKTYYTPGDTIWCMAFFVDGRTHQFFEKASPLVNVEWYNNEGTQVQEWLLKIEEGTAFFEIPVPYDFAPGTYSLKAYTQYQRNFDPEFTFQKDIEIISDISQEQSHLDTESEKLKYSINFYPEGGNLISGLKNRLTFKAQNGRGQNISVDGVLLDNEGTEVTTFKTYHEGIGFLDFIPEEGKSYTVKSRYEEVEKSFDVPKSLNKGHILSLDAKKKDFVIIQMESSSDEGLLGSTLLAHVRGVPFLHQILGEQNLQNLKLLRTDIPSGVVHFTLFNADGLPVCERLCYNKNSNEGFSLDAGLKKEDYSKRELLEFTLQSQDDQSLRGRASITAYNSDLNPQLDSEITIENYLMLLSDLKGDINNVDQYFGEETSKTRFFLDLVMMTHGWRKFDWLDVINEKLPEHEFGTQENISIAGVVHKKNKDEGLKADVFVSTINKDGISSVSVTTEEDGVFFLQGFEFKDTVDVIIQASKHDPKKEKGDEVKRSGKKNVDIELFELEAPTFDLHHSIAKPKTGSSDKNDLITNFKENRRLDSLYNPIWALEMEEFMVTSLRKTEKQKKIENLKDKMKSRGILYFPSSQKIFLDDLPGGGYQYNNIFDIVRDRAPGVRVKGSGSERYFVIRNTGNLKGDIPALVLLDGSVISRPGDIIATPDNILAIDIVRGLSSASVYGEAGAGGVVSIITKDPTDIRGSANHQLDAKGTIKFQHPGYYMGRTFYKPNYEKKYIDHQKPDLRTTLFWKQNVKLDDLSKTFKFFTGDKVGNYIIKVEGITADGVPFVSRKTFKITE